MIPAVTAAAVLAGGGVAWGLVANSSPSVNDASVSAGALRPPTLAPRSSTDASRGSATSTPHPTTGPSSSSSSAARHHAARHRPARHQAAPPALSLTITGGASYLEVRHRSGRLVVQSILHHGQHRQFRGHDLQVVLGNAGAVRLAIHGHHGHLAGSSGEVRRFTIS